MNVQKFTYLKAGEETPSNRVLAAVRIPSDLVSALDLTGLSEEDATKAERLYAEWLETVQKPYTKLENEFRKANLKSWNAFAVENGLGDNPPMVKSFKSGGLTPA